MVDFFRAAEIGVDLELRCIGGDRRKDRQKLPLEWRS